MSGDGVSGDLFDVVFFAYVIRYGHRGFFVSLDVEMVYHSVEGVFLQSHQQYPQLFKSKSKTYTLFQPEPTSIKNGQTHLRHLSTPRSRFCNPPRTTICTNS